MSETSIQPSNEDLLQQAANLAEEGKRPEARSLVRQAVRNDSSDVEAWWALTQLASSDAERQRALREVLKIEPTNPHALHMRDQLMAGTLQSIDTGFYGARSHPTVMPVQPMLLTMPKDYMAQALVTLVAYGIFWFAGLGMNVYFLNEARQLQQTTGQEQRNVGCLKALLAVNIGLGVLMVGAMAMMVLAAVILD